MGVATTYNAADKLTDASAGRGSAAGFVPALGDGGMMQRREVVLGMMTAAGAAVAAAVPGFAPHAARAQATVGAVDRVGLLLPKSAGPFARVSAAVRAGVEAGYHRDGLGLAVDIYEIEESPAALAAAYRGMLELGTAMVLGPLTRNGAAALLELGDIPITTIALNQAEGDAAVPWNVIVFTLAIESEAQQIAAAAMQEVRGQLAGGRLPRAIIITAATALGRRGAAAFLERWRSLGGEAEAPLELEQSALYKFRTAVSKERGDLFFLSMNTDLARPVRTIIGRTLPVYGTSLLSVGGAESGLRAPELDGVRLLEMPGVIQPNYAAALGYPQAPADFSLEMQRLYSLGVDAFRVARALLSGRPSFEIDGLTGRLRYDGSQPAIERQPFLAEYRGGTPFAL
jgi:outer membrane PBP1 activator LpoA protein